MIFTILNVYTVNGGFRYQISVLKTMTLFLVTLASTGTNFIRL